ncbi:hypothetical protein Tco_1493458 [Tanacetum coccineum]
MNAPCSRRGCGYSRIDLYLDGLSVWHLQTLGHCPTCYSSKDVEEREEEEVPLRRKRSVYRRARTEFNTPAFEQFQAPLSADVLPQTAVSESAGPSVAADKGKAPMSDLDIPAEFLAEDAQARKRFEEEQAKRAKELDDLMMRMTETDWLNLMMQVGSNPALACELLGADVTEANFIERITAIKEKKKRALADLRYRALKGKPMKQSEPSSVPAATTQPADDPDSAGGGSSPPAGSATPLSGSAALNTAGGAFGVTDSTVTTTAAMDSAGSYRHIGSRLVCSRVAADHDSDDEIFLEIIFQGKSVSGHGVVVVDNLPDDEIVDPRVKVETVFASASSPPRSRRKHIGVRGDDVLWDKRGLGDVELPPGKQFISMFIICRTDGEVLYLLEEDVDIGLDLWRDVNMLCQSLHSDDVEDFWRTQDEWVVSSWKLYPKSSVHVLDLTNGKTVYMFVDKFYPIRATLLDRNGYATSSQFPPSYCRMLFVCTARQMVFSSPWLTAKKESGSPLQTALVYFSNPLIALLIRDVAASFDSVVHRVHAVSFDAAVASTVFAACIVAAGYIVSAGFMMLLLTLFLLLLQSLLREDSSRKIGSLKESNLNGIKWFLLIMFLLVMFSFLLTDIESADLNYRRDYCMQEL